MEGTPLWLDEPYEARAPLHGDVTADVAVVGAGMGGIATALHLAARGLRPVVLEARTVASGASGRNGGFLIAGPAPFHNDARRQFGPELARRIYAATLDAQQQVYALADELGADGVVRRVGALRLAQDAEEAEHVRELHAALRDDGFPGELVAEDALPAVLRRPGRVGLYTPHDAGTQPARLVRALARGAEARGARIYEGSAVRGPLDGAGTLETTGGRVRAGAVVVACDGALSALVPRYAGAHRQRRLHMVATAPTGPIGVDSLVYARWGYEYHQQLPDGRIALGGYSDLDGPDSYVEREEASARVHERLVQHLHEELGVDAPITHRWVGLVGFTGDQRPYSGAVPGCDGLYALGGYCGTGNLNAFVSGRVVSELIADGRSPDADLYDAGRERRELPLPT